MESESTVSSSSSLKRATEDNVFGSNKKIHSIPSSSSISKLPDIIDQICQQRTKREISQTLVGGDLLTTYTELHSYQLLPQSIPGILSLDIHYEKDLIACAGSNANTTIFHQPSGQGLGALVGHWNKVNCVKFQTPGDFIVTGSTDKTVRLWKEVKLGYYKCMHVLMNHTAEVKAVTINPAESSLFVTASSDNIWNLYNLSGDCIAEVGSTSGSEGYTSAAFHPSGRLLGTGNSNALINIWDSQNQATIAKLDGHKGAVTALSFSDNGYHLATAARDGFRLWDLRRSQSFIKSLNPFDPILKNEAVEFDQSGRYLALGSSAIGIYDVTSAMSEPIAQIPYTPRTGPASCMKFGPNANYIAVGTWDENLRIFGVPKEDGPSDFLE